VLQVGYVNSASANSTNTSTTTQSVSYSPTAGNVIVVALSVGAGVTTPTCQDNNSNFLTVGPSQGTLQMFYGVAITGASSYTCNWAGSTPNVMAVVEYTGLVGQGDNAANSQGTANSGSGPASLSATNYFTNSFIVAAIAAQMTTSAFFGNSVGGNPVQGTFRIKAGYNIGSTWPDIAIIDNAGMNIGGTVSIQVYMNCTSLTQYYMNEVEVYIPPVINQICGSADFQWGGGDGW
jgi:hypothetical protein